MNNSSRFIFIGIILLAVFIGVAGCKKKTEDPVIPYVLSHPSFSVTYSTVQLQTGGAGLQFYAKCTNNGITMTKVTVTDPASSAIIYNYNGASFAENVVFPMQDSDVAYTKQTGTWSFSLVGNRKADGAAFTVDTTLSVSK